MTQEAFITRDELIKLLGILYQGTINGRDYVVTHPVDRGTSDIAGDAVVFDWLVDDTPPKAEDIARWKRVHAAKLEAFRNPPIEVLREQMPSLTKRQFRLGLLGAGISITQIETTIAAIPDATERAIAEIEWQDASQYERLHPLVVTLSGQLGMTAEQVDALWEQAALL